MKLAGCLFFCCILAVGFISRSEALSISSPEFNDQGLIPEEFTCQGQDVNPELSISGVPENARSLVLIVDDPDAPGATWVHWVVFNIPVTDTIGADSVPGVQGVNDFGKKDYGGPCPPSGTHRYFFKVYALDAMLALQEGATKQDVEAAIEGHILEQAELIGLYRQK